jgi:tetratricopeptide (TPR) repeat protein
VIGATEVLEDQLQQVDRDLAELDEQVAAGELDAATAEELRATYRGERSRILDQIEELGAAGPATSRPGPDRRRAVMGTVLLLAAFAVVTVVLVGAVRERGPNDLATGGIASDVASGSVDLSQVTNEEMEQVVAANPDVPAMRLALATRYFEAGEFDKALDHFLVVLEQRPDDPEALGSIGWMTFLSDRPDVAETYVERALQVDPDYVQGYWFLGNIRLLGLGDSEGAIAPLERLLAYEGIPDEVRTQAEELLARARTGS